MHAACTHVHTAHRAHLSHACRRAHTHTHPSIVWLSDRSVMSHAETRMVPSWCPGAIPWERSLGESYSLMRLWVKHTWFSIVSGRIHSFLVEAFEVMEKTLVLVHFSAVKKKKNPTSFFQNIWNLNFCPFRKGRVQTLLKEENRQISRRVVFFAVQESEVCIPRRVHPVLLCGEQGGGRPGDSGSAGACDGTAARPARWDRRTQAPGPGPWAPALPRPPSVEFDCFWNSCLLIWVRDKAP